MSIREGLVPGKCWGLHSAPCFYPQANGRGSSPAPSKTSPCTTWIIRSRYALKRATLCDDLRAGQLAQSHLVRCGAGDIRRSSAATCAIGRSSRLQKSILDLIRTQARFQPETPICGPWRLNASAEGRYRKQPAHVLLQIVKRQGSSSPSSVLLSRFSRNPVG
jgi:hypothetical protein